MAGCYAPRLESRNADPGRMKANPSREARLNWNRWIRQAHRWLAIIFTTVVVAIFVLLGVGRQPAQWIYYLPLPPLFLLMFSGLYVFVLPYSAKWRSTRGRA